MKAGTAMKIQQTNENCIDAGHRHEPKIAYLSVEQLYPGPTNPRKHSLPQIRAIAKSIEAFSFNAPILVDRTRKIVAGHGRYEAAKFLGLVQVPVIFLDHLTETQAKAYRMADNKLTDRSTWDDNKVALQLKELSESVRRLQAGLQSFLSMRRIEARRKNASAFRLRFSQSLASLRQRLSHAMVRSTDVRTML